jgi:hypothetical protein
MGATAAKSGFLRFCGRGTSRLLGGRYEKTRSAQARGVPAGVAAAPAGVRRRGSVPRLLRHGGVAEHGLCVRMGLYCPRGVDCAECAPALQVALEVPQRGKEKAGVTNLGFRIWGYVSGYRRPPG